MADSRFSKIKGGRHYVVATQGINSWYDTATTFSFTGAEVTRSLKELTVTATDINVTISEGDVILIKISDQGYQDRYRTAIVNSTGTDTITFRDPELFFDSTTQTYVASSKYDLDTCDGAVIYKTVFNDLDSAKQYLHQVEGTSFATEAGSVTTGEITSTYTSSKSVTTTQTWNGTLNTTPSVIRGNFDLLKVGYGRVTEGIIDNSTIYTTATLDEFKTTQVDFDAISSTDDSEITFADVALTSSFTLGQIVEIVADGVTYYRTGIAIETVATTSVLTLDSPITGLASATTITVRIGTTVRLEKPCDSQDEILNILCLDTCKYADIYSTGQINSFSFNVESANKFDFVFDISGGDYAKGMFKNEFTNGFATPSLETAFVGSNFKVIRDGVELDNVQNISINFSNTNEDINSVTSPSSLAYRVRTMTEVTAELGSYIQDNIDYFDYENKLFTDLVIYGKNNEGDVLYFQLKGQGTAFSPSESGGLRTQSITFTGVDANQDTDYDNSFVMGYFPALTRFEEV